MTELVSTSASVDGIMMVPACVCRHHWSGTGDVFWRPSFHRVCQKLHRSQARALYRPCGTVRDPTGYSLEDHCRHVDQVSSAGDVAADVVMWWTETSQTTNQFYSLCGVRIYFPYK